MEIKEIDIGEIKPYEKNAKLHDQKQIDNVAESIKQFGFRQNLVLDRNNVIIIGHCRYEASKKLGLKTVPCVFADDLTDEQVKKLRVLDNKLNESDWDNDLLFDDIGDLEFDGFDIDFGLLNPDDFGEDFELPDGEKSNFITMSFVLSNEQAEEVKEAMETCGEIEVETFGNTNKHGNELYGVICEWKRMSGI